MFGLAHKYFLADMKQDHDFFLVKLKSSIIRSYAHFDWFQLELLVSMNAFRRHQSQIGVVEKNALKIKVIPEDSPTIKTKGLFKNLLPKQSTSL